MLKDIFDVLRSYMGMWLIIYLLGFVLAIVLVLSIVRKRRGRRP